MSKLALITGGTSGIGYALAKTLIEQYKIKVVAIGRNSRVLEELKTKYTESIISLNIDFSQDFDKNVSSLIEDKVDYFVHSATTLDPIGNSLDATADSFLNTFKINTLSMYKLVKDTLPLMQSGTRILNISSRVAQSPIQEFGIHSVTKAATEALVKVFKTELNPRGILLNNIHPGVVDTPAQQRVRALPVDKYPVVKNFITYKNEGKILTPERSAGFIADVLINSSDKEFQESFWSFYDSQHWKDLDRS